MVSPAFVVFAPFFVREAIYFLTGKLTVFRGYAFISSRSTLVWFYDMLYTILSYLWGVMVLL